MTSAACFGISVGIESQLSFQFTMYNTPLRKG